MSKRTNTNGTRAHHNMGAWARQWVSRKSRIGLRAIEPRPAGPGKPWWTTPPTVAPLDAAILYAISYREELIKKVQKYPQSNGQTVGLLRLVNEWLVHARRLRHEQREREARLDLDDALKILDHYQLRPAHRRMVAEIRERHGLKPRDPKTIDRHPEEPL